MKMIDELQQLKGIGLVLAKRLRDAGLGSFDSIAEAGAEGLRAIPGINQRRIPGIVQQAALLSGSQQKSGGEHAQELGEQVEKMRGDLHSLAKGARERFGGKLAGKRGRRLGENLVRIADALDRIAESGKHRKRSQKGLAKVQVTMESLDQVKLKKFCKGLKKSRKVLAELAR